MRIVIKRASFLLACAGLSVISAIAQPLANTVTSEVAFSIPRDQSKPFVKHLLIKAQGRIELDITSLPKGVEVTMTLRRPGGSVAGDISGTGGNLSLTYFATEREINDSLAAKNVRWSVSITRASGGEGVSGRLKMSHPG